MQNTTLAETAPLEKRIRIEDQAAFVACFGHVFEHSPWIAQAAWRPDGFSDADALMEAMAGVVAAADEADQMQLLCAHPELGGQEARSGTLTAASSDEQASVGLQRLSAEEAAELRRLNAAYRERHGFPFIVCVRHYTKLGIFAELDRRTKRPTRTEREEALAQVIFIARARLSRFLAEE